MFNTLKYISDPDQFRIINLISDLRLPTTILESVLDISSDQMSHHLDELKNSGIINCDLSYPLDMCRVDQTHVKEHVLFHSLASIQMSNNPIYQADLITLKQLVSLK